MVSCKLDLPHQIRLMDVLGSAVELDQQVEHDRLEQLHQIGRMGVDLGECATQRAILSLVSQRALSGHCVLHSHATSHLVLPVQHHFSMHLVVYFDSGRLLAATGQRGEDHVGHHSSARLFRVHVAHCREHTGHERDGAIDWHLLDDHDELDVHVNHSHHLGASISQHEQVQADHVASFLLFHDETHWLLHWHEEDH